MKLLLDSVILIDHFNGAAQQHGLRFVTRNQKDFPPRLYRFVDIPYRV